MRLKNQFKQLLVIGFLCLFGCTNFSAYTGEPEKRTDVAVIKGVSPWFAISPIGIVIKAVDGKQVNRFTSQVRVTPGLHQLDVVCYVDIDQQRFFIRHKLEVDVAGGNVYHLSSQQQGDVCRVFLE